MLLATVFLPLSATAAEILWLRLYTQMQYRDSSRQCVSLRPGGAFLLAAELDGDRPRRVILSNFPYEWPYQYIYKATELTGEELSRLQIYRDAKNRAWLKRLEINELALRWILYQPAQYAGECAPPRPVAAVTPAPVAFDFETDDINLGLLLSYSQRIPFRGHRVDGVPFDARMRIMQEVYRGPWGTR